MPGQKSIYETFLMCTYIYIQARGQKVDMAPVYCLASY
jgi:hypothetical protein